MHRHTLLIALAATMSAGAEGVELTAWQAGGAGGSAALGSASDATTIAFALGGDVGGIHELDDSTLARLGFWSVGSTLVSTAIQPRTTAQAQAIRAAYDGSRLHVDLHADAAVPASIRLVGVDGRAVEPAWAGTLAAGSTRRTIDMDRHRGQVLYLLVEVGPMRRSYQIHDVSR